MWSPRFSVRTRQPKRWSEATLKRFVDVFCVIHYTGLQMFWSQLFNSYNSLSLSYCRFNSPNYQMGELMNASHCSLRDDFEVSCTELDVLMTVANEQSGVLGSRMTGGGFGGCTVTLVRKQAVSTVIERMRSEYSRRCGGQEASFYVCEPSQGARLLSADVFVGK